MSNKDSESLKHACSILSTLQILYRTGQMCDVILVSGIDGYSIRAHRLVLSACSEYFLTMFTTVMTELIFYEIRLDKIKGFILKIMLDYCYTGHLTLCDNTVVSILKAANLMKMNKVATVCIEYLVDRLNTNNCWSYWNFAYEHAHDRRCRDLCERSKDYVIAHFMKLRFSYELTELNFEQLSDLITRDDLYVKREDNVFFALVTWVMHRPNARIRFIPQLFQMVRLPYLEAEYTKRCVKRYSRHYNCEEFVKKLVEHRNRRKHKQLIVVSNYTREMQLYEPTFNKWITWHELPFEIRYVDAIAAFDDELLVISTSPKRRVHVFCYNMIKHEWTKSVPMKSHRFNYSTAVIGKHLFVFGGLDAAYRVPVNTVERWDIKKNAWSRVAKMPTKRYDARFAVMDNCLYVTGGFLKNKTVCNSLECFNPKTNTWTTKTSTQYDFTSATLGVRHDILYAFGTSSSTGTYFERYDKQQDQWTVIFESNCKLDYSLTCVLYEDKFLLMNIRGHFFSFDPMDNTFERKPSLSKTTNKIRSVIVPNTIPHRFKHC